MTEEVKIESPEVVPSEPEVEVRATESKSEPELSEVESQAFKEGWRPKEQYNGEEAKWIPADEFMRRKPLFEKIDSLKSETYNTRKEIQNLKKTLDSLAQHHQKVRETEYSRALEDLKAERRVALNERDIEAVEAIEEKLDVLKEDKTKFEQQIKAEKQAVKVEPTPEFVDWVKDNGWYHTDKEMHDFADSIAQSHLQKNPTASPKDIFEYVNKQTKRAFPEQFTPQDKRNSRPSPVDSGDSGGRSVAPKDDLKLSPEEDEVARRFERSGIMTRKEYAAELRKINKR